MTVDISNMTFQDLSHHVVFANAVHYVCGMDVAGDVIEFGVHAGASANTISSMLANRKKLWLLDSFVGFPESHDPQDTLSPHVMDGTWPPGGSRGYSVEECRAQFPDAIVLSGWFKDLQENFAAKGNLFSLIHADCDLYVSTMDALVPLFKNRCVADGAILLLDDWNCNHASDEFGQRAAWKKLVPLFNIRYSDEGGYGVAAHKFIIHSYDEVL